MTTTTTGDGGQAPTTGIPGAGQAPTGGQDQQQAGAQAASQLADLTDDTPLDSIPESVRGYVAKLRQESAAQRAAARQASEQVQQYQRERETDAERAQREAAERQQRLDALERENRDLKVGTAVQTAANTAGAHNPAAVWELVQARGMTVETDDKGKPTNTAALLKALQQSDPWLFKAQRGDSDAGAGGGAGASPGGVTDMNAFIRNGGRRVAR